MKKMMRGGFTLIELLVVITIIGILATGATTVFTSQIQKSRDSVRVTDLSALKAGIEQFYNDDGLYPDKGATSFTGVIAYVPKLPEDPQSGLASANSVFDYLYNVSADANTIPRQQYEISAHFEQAGNITRKAATDGGNDQYRLEFGIGIDLTNKNTIVDLDTGIPASTTLYTCLTPAGATGNCSTAADPMLIRTQ